MLIDKWIKELREKRKAYGISQNKLAVTAGITRECLNRIENGKTQTSKEIQAALKKALNYLSPDTQLEMLIDYVRIRFPTQDIKHIIENVLQLKIKYMIHEDYGFYGYTSQYVIGDIFVLAAVSEEKGVLLELKGKGCRQFESYLLAQGRSWYDFFMDVLIENGVFKRLDLAINDKAGILDIPELAEKCRNEECISIFRSFRNYRSGDLVKQEDKPDMGSTLYIGSLKSEVYFCVYEKAYEQYIKNGTPIEETEVKNRFEIRLKNLRAYKAVVDLLEYQDAEKTAFSIINRYIRFVDKVDGKERRKWPINSRWAYFRGSEREQLRLTVKPEKYTYEKTLRWLSHQVAPTLKMALKLDQEFHTNVIKEMIQNAKLSERHKKIYQQNVLQIEKIINEKERGEKK